MQKAPQNCGTFCFVTLFTLFYMVLVKLVLWQLGQGGILSLSPKVTSKPHLVQLYSPLPGFSPVFTVCAIIYLRIYDFRTGQRQPAPFLPRPFLLWLNGSKNIRALFPRLKSGRTYSCRFPHNCVIINLWRGLTVKE